MCSLFRANKLNNCEAGFLFPQEDCKQCISFNEKMKDEMQNLPKPVTKNILQYIELE